MAALSSDANKPRLSFAKVAASAGMRPAMTIPGSIPVNSQTPESAITPEAENETSIQRSSREHFPTEEFKNIKGQPTLIHELAPNVSIANPREKKNASFVIPTIKGHTAEPVSEENVTKIPSSHNLDKSSSLDSKSVASATTFTLDEKESLRPDDSASVKAIDDEDSRASTQAGSRIGSDSGARAFSDQLREISNMGPSGRQPAPVSRMSPAIPSNGGVLYSPLPTAGGNAFATLAVEAASVGPMLVTPPDEKLLEALNSVRDRVWVLKLEQDITDFVKDSSAQSFDVPQCNSFYRMLAHKMADYYLLGHTMDNPLSTVRLWKTPHCRVPPRLSSLTTPSTAASTPPPSGPQMKILRRGGQETGTGSREGGGQGGRHSGDADGDSGSDGGKVKLPASREEREARYEAARLRIMGSARPSEDPPAPEKKEDSRSSSAAGNKKNRKHRSDSEDGFEARSAYNTFSNSTMGPGGMNNDGHFYQPSTTANPMPYLHMQNHEQSDGYYGNYGQAVPQQQQSTYPYYQQGYAPASSPGNVHWQQPQQHGYDMSAHLQQSLSFDQVNMNGPFSPPTGNGVRGGTGIYAAPEQWSQYQQPVQNPQSPQYPGHPPHLPPQPYAYGVLPNGAYPGVKRQNPNHPLPGSFNRQQFNPQIQAFIPGQPSPATVRSPHRPNLGMSYPSSHSLQRQNSTHSQASSYASSHAGIQQVPSQLPSAHNLTHPLPQPVFSQGVSLQPRQAQQSYAMANPVFQSTTSVNGSQNGLAKYGAASLPAKPPPPASDGIPGLHGSSPSLRTASNVGSPMHALPSMSNFTSGYQANAVREGFGGA